MLCAFYSNATMHAITTVVGCFFCNQTVVVVAVVAAIEVPVVVLSLIDAMR